MRRLQKAKGTLPKCVVVLAFSGLRKARTVAAQSQVHLGEITPVQGISLPDSFFPWLAVVRCTRALLTAVTLIQAARWHGTDFHSSGFTAALKAGLKAVCNKRVYQGRILPSLPECEDIAEEYWEEML